jgi:hypothetical protein
VAEQNLGEWQAATESLTLSASHQHLLIVAHAKS